MKKVKSNKSDLIVEITSGLILVFSVSGGVAYRTESIWPLVIGFLIAGILLFYELRKECTMIYDSTGVELQGKRMPKVKILFSDKNLEFRPVLGKQHQILDIFRVYYHKKRLAEFAMTGNPWEFLEFYHLSKTCGASWKMPDEIDKDFTQNYEKYLKRLEVMQRSRGRRRK